VSVGSSCYISDVLHQVIPLSDAIGRRDESGEYVQACFEYGEGNLSYYHLLLTKTQELEGRDEEARRAMFRSKELFDQSWSEENEVVLQELREKGLTRFGQDTPPCRYRRQRS
jgi:hypothetical protein